MQSLSVAVNTDSLTRWFLPGVAGLLAITRYRCMAAPALMAGWNGPGTTAGGVSAHRLLGTPSVIFNRNDVLQDKFLAQHFGLRDALYPRHFVPAVDAFELVLELGMGWGMVPGLMLAARKHRPPLAEILSDHPVDVALYWQHWAREPLSAQRLTQAVRQAALEHLLQV